MAIAPPRVLTIAGSIRHASRQARDCTANASLSSTAPMSDQAIPAAASARSAASTGAIPNRCGSSAAAPRPAIRASGGHPGRRVLAGDQQCGRAVVERATRCRR